MKISIQTSLTPVKHLAQVSELYLLNYFLTSSQTILCNKKTRNDNLDENQNTKLIRKKCYFDIIYIQNR